MDKEELILKWLDNNLSPQELEAFKALEDYEALVKLSDYSQGFKAPEYNTDDALQAVLSKIETKKTTKTNWLKPLLKVAAILAICFGAYYYTTTLDTTFATEYAEKTQVELPDNSQVNLNALSKISFNKNDWNTTNRTINLTGEAFFKVTQGSTFKVVTDAGIVTVVGTEFNIKQRPNYFEVTCFEGEVHINYNTGKTNLKTGDSFVIINEQIIETQPSKNTQPDWLNNVSSFISVPLSEVLAEFERQYNVKIEVNTIQTSTLFSGKFTHNDINIALKSITEPLQLQFKKTNNTIILTRE
ncbi:FecR family protein [Olleya aquimaris]|uniref:FecR family protein n=1 Tax=Olleya aquimaris TaxID=639310 RepID=A0A327R891_9FLAO|nr:FecR domain-containing protein [Olleya aquimaris]RAJ11773.1 FecR family protein [Olleya aquimaris]